MTELGQPTAGILLIGNELLSGKTQDANLSFLAGELARLGIMLLEARVIRDDHETISGVVNEFRARFTYVFTTGGIGPTHDDITAESMARAFGKPLELNAEAVRMMESTGRKMNSSRLKMATVPQGASLIENSASLAPGFRLENVFVLAGVPHIARAMFAALESDLEGGAQILSASVDAHSPEGDISEALEQVALAHQLVEIGSYPYQRDGRYGANLVVRGTGPAAVQAALSAIETAMAQLGVETRRPQ